MYILFRPGEVDLAFDNILIPNQVKSASAVPAALSIPTHFPKYSVMRLNFLKRFLYLLNLWCIKLFIIIRVSVAYFFYFVEGFEINY